MEAWDRQSKETAVAYEAFCCYRDMGSARSGVKVGQELGKSKALLERWSSRWDWVFRCQQYDIDQEQQRRKEHEKEIQEARDRHVRIAQLMLQKFYERIQTLDAEAISPAVMVQLAKVGSDLELRALGDTEQLVVTGADGGPIQKEVRVILDALNDPEARDALDALSKCLESQSGGYGGAVV